MSVKPEPWTPAMTHALVELRQVLAPVQADRRRVVVERALAAEEDERRLGEPVGASDRLKTE